MKKKLIKSSVAISVFSIALAFSLPVLVGAINTQAQGNTSGNGNTTSGGNATSDSQSNSQQNAAPIQKKLGAENLKSCQNREGAIDNIMARISDRAQKQLTLMDQISLRVQNLYKDKNMSIGNYEALVATVAAKKAIADREMNTVRTMSRQFNCDSDDPKGTATQFKANTSLQSGALNDYKTAIINLINSVESATVSTEGAN
jgi:hypothetical protein